MARTDVQGGIRWSAAAVLPLFIGLVLLSSPVDAQSTPDRLVYVFASDDGRAATVFDRIPVNSAAGSVLLPVPEGADVRTIQDENGTDLTWARRSAGTLDVAASGSSPITIVTEVGSTRPGALEIRFGRGYEGSARVIAALPVDLVPDDERFSIDQAGVDALFAARWPIAEDRTLWVSDASAVEVLRFSPPVEHAPLSLAIVIGLFVILAGATVWLFARIHRGLEDPTVRGRTMGFLDHLDELRGRVLVVVVVVLVATTFFFTFRFRWMELYGFLVPVPWPDMFHNTAAQVYGLLARLVVPDGVQVVVTRPLDAAALQVGISVALALLVTFPVILYQLYAFLAPGLYPRERRAVFTTVPFILVLFVAGAVFGVWGIAPFIVAVLYRYAEGIDAVTFLNAQELVSFTVLFAVLFGIAFQLPAVMTLLVRIGVTRTYTYIKYWRHAVLGIAIVAGLVTDPTVMSQLIVGAVLLLLYGLGLATSYVVERRRLNRMAIEAAERERRV
ncbi:MAG: twin-arginine translocase subunit TatC [Euryarchaeota archaeon]|nr:twin-arginine translocase subunit TatC [Euryarchaeota archaeon]